MDPSEPEMTSDQMAVSIDWTLSSSGGMQTPSEGSVGIPSPSKVASVRPRL